MFSFTDGERAYFTEMRTVSTDDEGREILVGLTFEETVFYMEYSRRFLTGRDRDPDHRDRYLQLHDKHERARLAVLGAEIQARNDPMRH